MNYRAIISVLFFYFLLQAGATAAFGQSDSLLAADSVGTIKVRAPKPQTDTMIVILVPEADGYNYCDQLPSFEGYNEYIKRNLNYPEAAKEAGIEGLVIVRMRVDTSGRLSDLTILRGLPMGCNEEALRVLRSMPPWRPAQTNGRPVACMTTAAVRFTLVKGK